MIEIIGLDGASYDFIQKYSEELPFLSQSKRMDAGFEGKAKTRSPVCWMTIFSGKEPKEHGLYHDFLRRREQLDEYPIIFHDVDSIVNYLPIFCWPQSLNSELPDGPPEGIGLPLYEEEVKNSTKGLKNKHLEGRKRRPELLVTVFPTTDRMGHQFIDKEEKLLKFYKKMEEVSKELIEGVSEEDEWMIISDHGMKYIEGDWDSKYLERNDEHTRHTGTHDTDAIFLSSIDFNPERLSDIGKLLRYKLNVKT